MGDVDEAMRRRVERRLELRAEQISVGSPGDQKPLVRPEPKRRAVLTRAGEPKPCRQLSPEGRRTGGARRLAAAKDEAGGCGRFGNRKTVPVPAGRALRAANAG